jgi:hypothetical protein
MSITSIATRTLVVPSTAIDKPWAALRQIFDLQEQNTRFNFAFSDKSFPDESDRAKWDGDAPGSAILIDVGDDKYHNGFLSASDFQMMHSAQRNSHIWNKGVALINLNSSTGFLKRLGPLSIAAMIREIPHIFEDRSRGDLETFQYTMRVLRAMFRPANRRVWNDLFDNQEYANLKEIWEGFHVGREFEVNMPDDLAFKLWELIQEMNKKYPHLNLWYDDVIKLLPSFTLPGYFRRLFLAGENPAEIMRIMSWWLDSAKKVKRLENGARNKKYKFDRFEIPGATGAVVKVDNYFEGNAFTFKHVGTPHNPLALVVKRMPTGGVLIQSSIRYDIDFTELYNELKRREYKRWYYEERFLDQKIDMVMNQTWALTGNPVTGLKDEEFVSLVPAHVGYCTRL